MEYCNYHPLAPATFSCVTCHTLHCDHCANEGDRGGFERCFTCTEPLDPLGAANQATPFWRRLEESFRYPLKGQVLFLIVAVSLLTSVLATVPFALVWYLALTGAFLKYCFACLESTARGLLVPPSIDEAYSGGMALMRNLVLMLLAAGGAVFAAYYYLGPQAAALSAVLIVVAMPAAIIMYGMTESMLEALNPLNLLRLIASVGLPYGLLLGFIMIMSASVGVISELIGYEHSLLSMSLQSIVSNYYTVVMFHIMGYMIFQYQGELGFAAREDFGEVKQPRPARERLAAQIDIRLKEGHYNEVVALFEKALKKFPEDRDFNRRYFEFLYATGRDVARAASRYLDFLIRSQQTHQLVIVYKRVLQLKPDYRPHKAATRHRLASACKDAGDSLSAAKLVNGLHKDFPAYPQLLDAYKLMAQALADLPHRGEQARKCRAFVAALAKRPAPQAKAKSRPEPINKPKPIKRKAPGKGMELELVPQENAESAGPD